MDNKIQVRRNFWEKLRLVALCVIFFTRKEEKLGIYYVCKQLKKIELINRGLTN